MVNLQAWGVLYGLLALQRPLQQKRQVFSPVLKITACVLRLEYGKLTGVGSSIRSASSTTTTTTETAGIFTSSEDNCVCAKVRVR